MSIANVFQKAFTKKNQLKQSAKDEYRELVQRHSESQADDWNKADEQRLFQLINELGITEAQAMKDAATINTMIGLQQLASEVDTASTIYHRACETQSAALAERQESNLRLNAKCAAANGEMESAMEHFQRCQKAKGQINELKENNPHLFGS